MRKYWDCHALTKMTAPLNKIIKLDFNYIKQKC